MSSDTHVLPLILTKLPEKNQHPCWEKLNSMAPPTSKQELWKYTRTSQILQEPWQLSEEQKYNTPSPLAQCAGRLVFVNGNFCPQHTLLPKGMKVAVSKNAYCPFDPTHFFEALSFVYNTCLLDITIDKHAEIEGVVQIEYHHTQEHVFAAPALRINAGERSRVKFIEYFTETPHSCLHIRHLELDAADHSHVHIDKIQCGGLNAFVMNEDRITLHANTEFHINTMTISGAWTRNMLHISMMGTHSVAHLNGFYAPHGREFVDNHTCVYHGTHHCESHELYKGLMSDHSTGVFNGRIHVERDAQKTNAYQSNANLLSGLDAKMYTKPELEIYADDVKCSHGSTTGQIDEEALFYLKARGLSGERALQLLCEAFFMEIIKGAVSEEVAAHILKLLAQKGIVHSD